jgi:uncharacterized protein YdeI (YjbR/CyaY-like superfamily)
MATTSEAPILAFDSPRAWEAWLAKHHAGSEGVWLRIYKKASGKASVTYAERLIEAGRMKAPGLKEVEAARKDGRWQRAYDSPSATVIPEDFLKRLSGNRKAQTFFEGLSKANSYAIAYRLQTAKRPETRAKRMLAILAMLATGESFHP